MWVCPGPPPLKDRLPNHSVLNVNLTPDRSSTNQCRPRSFISRDTLFCERERDDELVLMEARKAEVISSVRAELCVDEHGELGRRTVGLKAQLTSSSRRLAEDLYATSTHFIMELVQNADDNAYAPRDVPYVQFFLTPEYLIVSNNELGFEERNVRALCKIGESTKTKKEGYIGEKGIGTRNTAATVLPFAFKSESFSSRLSLRQASSRFSYGQTSRISSRTALISSLSTAT